MTKFNIMLLLMAIPFCAFAIYSGYDAGSPYVFLIGVLGTAITVFFSVFFIRARRSMKPSR